MRLEEADRRILTSERPGEDDGSKDDSPDRPAGAPKGAEGSAPTTTKPRRGGPSLTKLWRGVRADLTRWHFRLSLARLFLVPLPTHVGVRLRVRVLRMAGLSIGRGTIMVGTPAITGGADLSRQLRVGRNCFFNVGCALDVHADLTIGDGAGLGQETMVLTASHKLGPPSRRFGSFEPLPVKIGTGAWLGARCTILPGVTVGDGAVVAAGAVVTKDVPPNALVAGVPAKIVRELA